MKYLLAGLLLLLLQGISPAQGLELKERLEWVDKSDMQVLENGVVEEVAVNIVDHVKRGQLLLRMDRREFQAALLEAKAGVARSRISSEDALRELTRTRELLERAYEQDAQLQRWRRTKAIESIQRRSAGL